MMKNKYLFVFCLVGILTIYTETSAQNVAPEVETVLRTISTRTSVRDYQEREVPAEFIEQMLRAAMAAPSAVNRQPWHFVVVTDRKQLDALAKANPNAAMLAKAPLAIVICGDMTKALKGNAREFWVQDCSAATENLLLAAHALGLGAVWTGTYPSQERCSAVSQALKLPETIIPLNTIVIGYPAEKNTPKDKWKPENISYDTFGNKTPNKNTKKN